MLQLQGGSERDASARTYRGYHVHVACGPILLLVLVICCCLLGISLRPPKLTLEQHGRSAHARSGFNTGRFRKSSSTAIGEGD
jgi:hypothetical protein